MNINENIEEYFCGLLNDFNFIISECKLVESAHSFRDMQHLCGNYYSIFFLYIPSVPNKCIHTLNNCKLRVN